MINTNGGHMSFGGRLKSLIEKKCNSQMDFASLVGITRSRLCNYINGRSEPDYATLCNIADTLQVSIDYLLGRNPLPNADFMGRKIFSDIVFGNKKPTSDTTSSWIPLYLSGSQSQEEAASLVGWIRETNQLVQPGEFRQPYALILRDDSMAPEIMPGDIAYIQPRFIYHPFMEQLHGQDLFGVRLHPSDEVGVSLKRCRVQKNLLIFYSNNGKYSPIIIDMNHILYVPLIGKLVSIWRNYLGINLLEKVLEAKND